MAIPVTGKVCPFISTPDRIMPCLRECQFCTSGKCDLANVANLSLQVKALTNKIDELSKKLK